MQNDIVKQPPGSAEATDQPVVSQPAQMEVKQSPESAASPQVVVTEQVPTDEPKPKKSKSKRTKEEHDPILPIHGEPRHVATKPTGIILVAVIICLCLVGAALYGGMTQTKAGKSVTTKSSAKSAGAATDDVDLNAVIEGAGGVASPAQAQDGIDALSDQTLGL